MQLPKFPKEASKPSTPEDSVNKRFMDVLSKPANRSVFGLLSYIRGKGNKAFNNLTKISQRGMGVGGKADTRPIDSRKPVEDFYSKDEKVEDVQQNKSLENLENIDSNQEGILGELLKQTKLTNNLLEQINDKPVGGGIPAQQENTQTASGSSGPGSMLKGAGNILRTGGKFVPGKAGKALRRLGARSYSLGGKLNNITGVPNELAEGMSQTTTGSTSLGGMLGGRGKKPTPTNVRGKGRLGKLLGGAGLMAAGMTGLSMFGGGSDYGDASSAGMGGGVLDTATTLADAVPATNGVTKLGKKAVEKGAVKAGAKATGKAGLKAATKTAGKALGKSLLKKIPGVGLIAGLGFGLERLMSGDILGAVGEVASGAASTVPGVGTAVSAAIDAGLAVKDIASASGDELPAQEELGDAMSQQLEKSPEAQKIASASEPEMPAAEQKEAIAEIQQPASPVSDKKSGGMGSMLKTALKYSSPLGFIGSTIAESTGSSLSSMLGTAAKLTPMGMLGNAISGGMESLTGINPIKEIGSAFGLTSPEKETDTKKMLKQSTEKPIPVKVISGDASDSMATEMKDGTLKDKTSSASSSNTIINAPSTVSYENSSAGEEPSIPTENISMDDPYMMQAVRGNFSMSP